MKTKHTLYLALLCAFVAPVALYAVPGKTAAKKITSKPVVEYCVFYEFGSIGYIKYPDGTKTELRPASKEINPGLELTKLARSGWRVITGSSSPGEHYWTLERRR